MGATTLSSRAIIGRFYNLLEQGATNWIEKLSFYSASDQDSEEYKWLGMVPQMREMLGGRQAQTLRENGVIIKNKDFEMTLEFTLKELGRDKTGQIEARLAEAAERANSHFAKLLSTLIINGEAATCYDGQYFFDTDHAEGDSGSQSNDLSVDISALPVTNHGSTTIPSVAELQFAIMQAVQAIYGFKDDQGEPLNELAKNFLCMVPVSLWQVASQATKNPVIDGGDTNVIVNLDGFNIELVANPRLTWTDKFAIFRTDGIVKPFIRQEEVPVQVSAIAEGSELEFEYRKHRYGLYASRNVGYGYWQHGCLVTMT